MFGSLLITLREGLEAALIIGIILGYLSKIEQKRLYRHIFAGIGLGALASVFVAFLFQTIAGGFEGRAEEIFEGTAFLIAVIILTTMLLWMNRQSKSLSSDIKEKINSAINSNQVFGLVALAFISVFREGIEIVLFMNAAVFGSSLENSAIGGALGLLIALAIAWLIFKSTLNLNLKTFFQITGTFIIFIAAGMLASSAHEFAEAGLFPAFIEHIWDLNGFLNDGHGIGAFLKAVFGYNANPSLTEVVAYLAYLFVAFKLFFFPNMKETKT